jgi:hypothetical protein
MKKRTIYTLPKDTEVSGDLLAHIIESNKPVLSIFSKLESYVDDEPKMDRTPPNDLLTINNFAQYITSINGGYLLGAPVDYRATGEQKLDPIT